MRTIKTMLAMSILSIIGMGATAQNIKTAGKLFKAGRFAEAEKQYVAILEKDPENVQALIYMGYINLLSNSLDESERWLNKAKAIKPKMKQLDYFFAQIYYRRKEFLKSAPFFRSQGREAMAKKMESFSTIQPYSMEESFDEIRLKFIITDPLPVVRVVVNENEGNFFIDTGGGELILNESFAGKAQITSFGIEKGSEFGGGKKAPIGHGCISSLMLDGKIIKNIPIVTIDLSGLELGGIKIDGAIGTIFLSQFLSTIDYKNGELILRNKLKYNSEMVVQKSNSPSVIPFVMADDHFMMVRGTVNQSDTLLLFVDTGLAGNAFTCPKSTLKKAGLKIRKDTKARALGGGGYYDCYAFDIDNISINGCCVKNLHGQFGPFPQQIEKSFGFDINGLVSHEFFRNFIFTLDFGNMKYIIAE